jgi:hypothetical protein
MTDHSHDVHQPSVSRDTIQRNACIEEWWAPTSTLCTIT